MYLRETMFVKVTLRHAKEDVDKVCIEVQKTSDNAGGKPTRDSSLQHKTFSALNYAQDFGTTVKESLKRSRNSKWPTLILVPRARRFLVTWSGNEGLWRQPLPDV